MRWAGHVARIGEKRNAYRILVGKPEGRSPLRRCDGSIKMGRKQVGVVWTGFIWRGIETSGRLL
jgi:hypothetical protein